MISNGSITYASMNENSEDLSRKKFIHNSQILIKLQYTYFSNSFLAQFLKTTFIERAERKTMFHFPWLDFTYIAYWYRGGFTCFPL